MTTPTEIPLFLTNPSWYSYDDANHVYVLTDIAPPEAKQSYAEFYKMLDTAIPERPLR